MGADAVLNQAHKPEHMCHALVPCVCFLCQSRHGGRSGAHKQTFATGLLQHGRLFSVHKHTQESIFISLFWKLPPYIDLSV